MKLQRFYAGSRAIRSGGVLGVLGHVQALFWVTCHPEPKRRRVAALRGVFAAGMPPFPVMGSFIYVVPRGPGLLALLRRLPLAGVLSVLCFLCAAGNLARAADSAGHNYDVDDGDWVELFSGEDLNGWVNVNSAPETWIVRDGMLHCTGFPISALRTDRQYENFILELEWRHLEEGGNSGVFLWASPLAAPGVPFLRGIEAQVLDHGYGESDWFTTDGDVFPIHGATLEPFPPSRGMRSFPSEERSKGTPEWNHYRIVCNDGVIRLHVNGKEVSGGENANYRKGYIALEAEGAPIDFRNIRVVELPSTDAPAEKTAAKAQGHRTLYTGTDLRGWHTAEEDASAATEPRQEAGRWQVNDWRLVLQEGERADAVLWTLDSFADAEFIVDCHVAAPSEGEKAVSPVVLLRGEKGGPDFAVTLDATPGSWHRFTLRVVDGGVTVLQGDPGVEIDSFDLPENIAERGAFGLVDVPGRVQFSNLNARDLD